MLIMRIGSLSIIVLCACHHRAPTPIERGLDAVTRAERSSAPERVRFAGIHAAYVELARSAGPPDRLSNHDLALLFDGTTRETFYMHDAPTILEAARLLGVMQTRGIAIPEQYRELHEAFIGARMFDDARTLAEQHSVPDLEPVPDLRSADLVPGQPTELTKAELLAGFHALAGRP